MSSTYANVSIPSAPLGTPAGRWLAQAVLSVRRALDAAVSARPSQGLQEMAAPSAASSRFAKRLRSTSKCRVDVVMMCSFNEWVGWRGQPVSLR